MGHFGEQLRDLRLAKGLTLETIASETRIGSRYLEALETGDWKQLPQAIFARSFARQYAQFVGLDPASIEPEIQAAFPTEENIPVVPVPEATAAIRVAPLTEWLGKAPAVWERLPRPVFSLLAVLGACAGVYMGWQRLVLRPAAEQSQLASSPGNQFPPTKLPLAPGESAPVPPAVSQVSHEPAQTTSIELAVPPGEAGSGMAVRISASQETWVSITANGKRLYSGILQPNETRVLSGVERAKMVIGNAGGVDVSTDGRSIGPIGPSGQVRVVVLTPDGPQIMRLSQASDTGSGNSSEGQTS